MATMTRGGLGRTSEGRSSSARPADAARWAALSGLAVALLLLIEYPSRVALGSAPSLADSAGYADFVARHSDAKLTIILVDMFMMASILVFLAGFHNLIRRAREELEWLGTLIFGAGLALVTITLVADSVEGGTVLDTLVGTPDPTVVKALTEGYLLLFGSMGCILIALLIVSVVLLRQKVPGRGRARAR